MKKLLFTWFLLSLISLVSAVNAQSGISLGVSQQYTSFRFADSEGNTLNSEYSGIFNGAYGVDYRYVLNNGIMFRVGVGMRKAGATLVYDAMNYKWDLQYAVGKLGAGYIFRNDVISPYLTVSGYFGYMLTGYQTVNNEDFDVKDLESMAGTDFGLCLSPGVEISFTDALAAFVELSYLMGLQNLEKDEEQKSSNYACGLTLGLSFSFIK